MTIKVMPAEDADMARIFEIASTAFARNEPVWDGLWPEHWTAAGRKQGGERMTLTKNSDPHTVFLKALNESGDIIGMASAKWNIFYPNVKPDYSTVRGSDTAEYLHTEEDKHYVRELGKVFLTQRNEAIERTKGNMLSLDVLAIDPLHQRKGAGDALVKWGVAKADELGLEAVVESSLYGKGLYEKNGFVFRKHVEVFVPGEHGRPTGGFAWLERPKKAVA